MWARLRERTILVSALATAIAGLAVLVIARVTGADAVGRAFDHIEPQWIGLVAGAELMTYPAYMLAYRSIARMHGHAPLNLPIVARIVVAGFGPFALSGGFGIDKQALRAINEDEHSAQVRVSTLGTLEWAVLAPLACVISIIMLVSGADVMASLLWPWAVAVPAGFALAIWATAPHRTEWLGRFKGRRSQLLTDTLKGVGALRVLVRQPREYFGAWFGTSLYWAVDIFAFYGGLRTFGLDPSIGKVIIAYATGYAATRRSLPLGGAGLTEVLMIYALYWVREPLAPALAAVLTYRVFNFLLVAAPAVIARRQLEPMFSGAALRRRTRPATPDHPTQDG